MPFIDIPTLSNGHVDVLASSVYRISRGNQAAGQAALTRVDFGSEHQLTQMAASAVADLLRNAHVTVIALTAPDGTPIYLNAANITVVRDADPHIDPPEANAVVTVAGYRQAVQQTRAEVQQALPAAA
jgi:hypothetical protein